MFLYGHKQLSREEINTEGYYNPDDDLLGYSPKKNVKSHTELIVDGEVIYSVDYHFDEFGRRITPVKSKELRNKFAVFLGGSNTFGEGVRGDQTIAAYFSEKAKSYNPYNYGFRGYGTNQVLSLIESDRLKNEVQEDSGIGVYHYLSFHRERLLGTSAYFSWSNGHSPSYVLKEEGIERTGLFNKSRYFYYYSLRYLNYLRFISTLNINVPDIYSDYSNKLMCEALKKSKKEFLSHFPTSQFVILVSMNTDRVDPIIEGCLEPNKISYINLRKAWEDSMGSMEIKRGIEAHYNQRVYSFLADKLVEWVEDNH